MKSNRTILIAMGMALLLFLAACGNAEESNATPAENNKEETTSEETEDNQPETDASEDAAEEEGETPTEEEAPKTEEPSLKDDYLKKLNETKKELDALQPTDESTYALKNVEGERFDVWDGLLNEIYQVLEKQLPEEEMEQLRVEQREWIKHRDNTAKEASLEYEGGTMEQLEYTAVLNDLTEERCFELVENYMK